METNSLNFFTLFINASFIVQLVVLILIAASVWSWALLFYKIRQFREGEKQDNLLLGQISLLTADTEELYTRLLHSPKRGPLSTILFSVFTEMKQQENSNIEALEAVLYNAEIKQIHLLKSYTSTWATTASAAPFIGLFGTVWGIMVSFSSIANAQQISLAVVAPGISEALFATAIGLVAAIPAVIFYNTYQQKLGQFEAKADSIIRDVLIHIKKIHEKT